MRLPSFRPTARNLIRVTLVLAVVWLSLSATAWFFYRPRPVEVVELPPDPQFRRQRVTALTYTPDGRYLFVATAFDRDDGGVARADVPGRYQARYVGPDRRFWEFDIESAPRTGVRGFDGVVRQVEFSRDYQTRLVVGAGVTTDRLGFPVGAVADRHELPATMTITGPSPAGYDPSGGPARLSPDGTLVAYPSHDDGGPCVRVWDVVQRRERFVVPGGRYPAFSPDSLRMACWRRVAGPDPDADLGEKKEVVVADTGTGVIAHQTPFGRRSDQVSALHLPAQSGVVVVCLIGTPHEPGGRTQLWNYQSGGLVAEADGGHQMAASPDGEWVVLGSPPWGETSGVTESTGGPPGLYRAADLRPVGQLFPTATMVAGVSADGAVLATLERHAPKRGLTRLAEVLKWNICGAGSVGWYDPNSTSPSGRVAVYDTPVRLAVRPDGGEVAVVVRPSSTESDRVEFYARDAGAGASDRLGHAVEQGLVLTSGVVLAVVLLQVVVLGCRATAARWGGTGRARSAAV